MGDRTLAVPAVAALALSLSLAAAVHAAPALDQLRQAGAVSGVDDAAASAVPAAAGRPVAAPATPAPGGGFTPADRVMPDFSFTPGKLCTTSDSDFQELRYAEQIAYCHRNVTQQMKQTVAQHYGVPESEWANYEFDHLIPLAIGGNSHVDNLWPQPRGGDNSDGKDKLENSLYLQMKAGQITQAEAVRQIYAWFNNTGLPKLRAAMAQRGLAQNQAAPAPAPAPAQ